MPVIVFKLEPEKSQLLSFVKSLLIAPVHTIIAFADRHIANIREVVIAFAFMIK